MGHHGVTWTDPNIRGLDFLREKLQGSDLDWWSLGISMRDMGKNNADLIKLGRLKKVSLGVGKAGVHCQGWQFVFHRQYSQLACFS